MVALSPQPGCPRRLGSALSPGSGQFFQRKTPSSGFQSPQTYLCSMPRGSWEAERVHSLIPVTPHPETPHPSNSSTQLTPEVLHPTSVTPPETPLHFGHLPQGPPSNPGSPKDPALPQSLSFQGPHPTSVTPSKDLTQTLTWGGPFDDDKRLPSGYSLLLPQPRSFSPLVLISTISL